MSSAENEPPMPSEELQIFWDLFGRAANPGEVFADQCIYTVVVDDAEAAAANILSKNGCKRSFDIDTSDGERIIVIECPNDFNLVLIGMKIRVQSDTKAVL